MSSDGFPTALAVPLRGERVALEPLAPEHAGGLWEAAQADEIWAWLVSLNSSRELFDGWFEASLAATREDREGVFAIRELGGGELVGSSRFMNVRPDDKVVEIGWSWFNPRVWRSGVNVETKLLQMTHAFGALGCVRVEFKTDARNERSRGAMAALPAQFEGVMRKHMIIPEVGQRDSAYYSVIDSEWPAVRANLEHRLAAT
jgi:RimJ/RimL family protein N-acetyltransferase